MEEVFAKLKVLGVDVQKAESEFERADDYADAVREYFSSLDFMRLGQALSRKQWQAASMKAMKMSVRARELGCVGIEKQMTGIRMNINSKNADEALQLLSLIVAKRVKILNYFQDRKKDML